jgi:CTP:molybdopterin cytidylyltransferase MocA
MTVAAVILAASVESALADAGGVPRVRRIADAAWSGGAMPIIVVAPDPDGSVAAALAGAEVTLTAPAPSERGPVGQIVRGIDAAVAEVTETTGALIWPARLCWAGPETVTSLVEAHGPSPDALLRPTYRGETGWPALLPLTALDAFRALPAAAMPDALLEGVLASTSLSLRALDLGDPGSVIDGATRHEDLPPYEGPAEQAGAHTHEWGEAVATTSEDDPIAGPTVAIADED